MITRNGNKSIALLAEVVAVMARYPGLRCAPVVDQEEGLLSISITIDSDHLQAVSLGHDLKYVADVAQVRHIAREYSIDAAKLEALLPPMDDSYASQFLTVMEMTAVIDVLTDEHTLPDQPHLIESALPKLVQFARALAGNV